MCIRQIIFMVIRIICSNKYVINYDFGRVNRSPPMNFKINSEILCPSVKPGMCTWSGNMVNTNYVSWYGEIENTKLLICSFACLDIFEFLVFVLACLLYENVVHVLYNTNKTHNVNNTIQIFFFVQKSPQEDLDMSSKLKTERFKHPLPMAEFFNHFEKWNLF